MDPPRQPFPILSNRQIYPEARKSRSDLNGSTTSLNSESNFGSRKYLNLIQDGSKFCLVQSNTLGKANTFKFSNKEWLRSKWFLFHQILFVLIFDADRHRSIERSSSRSNWPFARSQSTDRSLVRRSVHLLMSESNSNLSQMDSEVRTAF